MPSTSIRKTEYDPTSRILSAWFVASGKRYDFEGVPPETYTAFRSAFVKGRFFNNHIRNHFQYRRIPD
ncbi:KTSC domain-containing protein [Mesorhizobium sp. M2A.F.Ca.ET.042.01.1.1]|uniref:KTSC domain-containing protein n=1 Tax=Mesorhizobium sp. M2A.F.Ca.ET.042.01.1.1 TaxID=2496745 RepID=UPI000FCB4D99|nr:KTSC domain-containing protein [Mesorhizobium sp. M2A.F.Ca.ET.042.01.1.1]RUX25212.1 KTSC domain-containing protein [Mesorhizobium sp. M2A.F.Ca.ET.042.01.1.1]